MQVPAVGPDLAAQEPVHGAADPGIGLEAAAEQVCARLGGMLADGRAGAGGAAQRPVALVAGGGQQRPAGRGEPLPARALGRVPVLIAVPDEHARAGLDPQASRDDLAPVQRREGVRAQEPLGAGQARAGGEAADESGRGVPVGAGRIRAGPVDSREAAGGGGHRVSSVVVPRSSSRRCSSIQRL